MRTFMPRKASGLRKPCLAGELARTRQRKWKMAQGLKWRKKMVSDMERMVGFWPFFGHFFHFTGHFRLGATFFPIFLGFSCRAGFPFCIWPTTEQQNKTYQNITMKGFQWRHWLRHLRRGRQIEGLPIFATASANYRQTRKAQKSRKLENRQKQILAHSYFSPVSCFLQFSGFLAFSIL